LEKERAAVPGGLYSRFPLQAPPKKRRLSIPIGFINKVVATNQDGAKMLIFAFRKNLVEAGKWIPKQRQ